MMNPTRNVVLGTMNWGRNAQVKQVRELIEEFHRLGGRVLDTARVYQLGETEELIGDVLQELPKQISQSLQIHTKAHPLVSKLDRTGVREQLEASLRALRRNSVEVFYLHCPDSLQVPLLETLLVCDELYKEGKFLELGLSNFAAWDVVHAHFLCEKHALRVRPTVYQGLYNALSRGLDDELMPAVRTFGMRVYVFNPLSGGVLTGKYASALKEPTQGRFSPEFDLVPSNNTTSPMKGVTHKVYQARYWKQELLDRVTLIKKECEELGLTPTAAALRWCAWHSALRMDLHDGIIFGASNAQHVVENCTALLPSAGAGPLPPRVLRALDAAAQETTAEAYFRGYDAVTGKAGQYLSKF